MVLVVCLASVWGGRHVSAAATKPAATTRPVPATRAWTETVTKTKAGQLVLLLVPTGHDSAKPTPLVIYHHGAGENHTALLRDKLKADLVKAMLAEGWLLAGADAHGENWGRPEVVADYADLYDHVRATHKVSAVLHLGQSMGGLSSLQTVAARQIPAAGWAGIYPVCSIENLHGLGRFAKIIEQAHGGPGKWAPRDPVGLPPESFKGVPMRFYASYGDTIVPQGPNTDAMAARVKAAAAECEVIECQGDHGHPSHFQSADLIAFFKRCLDRQP